MVKKQLLPPIHNMTPIPTNTSPSLQLYQNLQTAFDFFNQMLQNRIPLILLALMLLTAIVSNPKMLGWIKQQFGKKA